MSTITDMTSNNIHSLVGKCIAANYIHIHNVNVCESINYSMLGMVFEQATCLGLKMWKQ